MQRLPTEQPATAPAPGKMMPSAQEALAQAEQRLQACEDRLRLVSQAIASVVIDWDLTSQAFHRINSPLGLMGYDDAEIAQTFDGVLEGLHPEDRPRFEHALQAWLAGSGTEFQMVVRSKHKDGTYRDLRGQAIVVREPSTGKPLRVVASYADVTAEYSALRALQLGEERYRLATEAIQGIVFDWNLPARKVYRSSGVTRMLGYTSEEMDSTPEWWQNLLHPDDREQNLYVLEQFIHSDTVPGILKYRIRHQQGHYLHVHSHCQAIRNAFGTAERIVGCIVDQTPRLLAEQAVREAEQTFHQLFHDIPQGLLVTDPAGKVIQCNQALARLLGGRTPNDFLGQCIHHELYPTLWSELLALDELTYSDDVSYHWEKQLHRQDGTIIPVLVRGKLIRYLKYHERCRFAILENLSDRKQAENERQRLQQHLQETQKLDSLGVLAGGIAHDFNNLLTVILGNISLIRQELPAGSAHQQALEQSEQASRQAAELCRQMLAYAGRGKLENKPFSLTELVESTKVLLSTAATRQHHLHFHLSRGIPCIAGDPSQIRQIILNLVHNAAEAIPQPAGSIDIMTGVSSLDRHTISRCLFAGQQEAGQYVWLEVRDNGQGMDDETRNRIFEPFFTTKFTGRGLGLAAVAGIVRTHRGFIQCHSVPQEGTFFRIYFPIDPSSTIAETATSSSSLSSNQPAQGTILVVDDEPSVRLVLTRLLSKRGYAVIEAENGNEALEMVARYGQELRLIILDLTMPLRDGLSALQEIREQKINTPVVIISGYYAHELLPQLESLKAKYISKPFTTQTLLSTIEPILAR